MSRVKLKKFLAELKRRRVYSVAITSAVVGWLVIQVVTQFFPPFEIPNWAERLVIVVIVLGFPIALVFAWVFDLTRHGLVRTEDMSSAARVDISPPANATTEKSIAVLPFNDLSAAKDHAYFGEGIAEELLGALAKVDGLRVAARRSSFWFKDREAELGEIASKLNVGHVLEGSVRRDGNRVRITAELIDACDGFTIWSETYEREMHGIFTLQDEITRSIVDTLKLKLAISPSRPSRSTAAYDAYLGGVVYSDKNTEPELRRSLEFFHRALEQDPKFSRAWTGTAKTWLWLADSFVPPLETDPKARDAATEAGERALQLDPPFAHYGEPALAALYRETGRFDDAIALYEKAREFTGRPGFGLAITYARMKRRKEALATLNTAIAGWGYRAGDAIAHVDVTLGAHDDAIRELEHACEQRSSSLHGVGIAPEFVPLRSDKRFRSIHERIGLEPENVFAATAP